MYRRGDKEFVLDMFLACQKILRYTEGMAYEEFINDERTKDAVMRNIEILGEAVKNLSKEFMEKYPNVKWSKIARARDKLIHFYFGIDEGALWDMVRESVPALFETLKSIITTEGWQDELEE